MDGGHFKNGDGEIQLKPILNNPLRKEPEDVIGILPPSCSTTADSSDFENSIQTELSKRINKEREELEGWLECKGPGNPKGTKTGRFGLDWWRYHIKIGGAENITLKIQNVLMDQDGDGMISQKELANNEKRREDAVNSALSLMTTQGVIGALILTVLYTLTITALVPSDTSLQFFGDVIIGRLSLTYRFFVTLGLCLSFALVYNTTRMYLQLSVWMPTIDMKSWFLSEISLCPLINQCQQTIICSLIAIPFGTAVQVDPNSGLLCLVVPLFVFILTWFQSQSIGIKLIAKMHELVCDSLRKTKSE